MSTSEYFNPYRKVSKREKREQIKKSEIECPERDMEFGRTMEDLISTLNYVLKSRNGFLTDHAKKTIREHSKAIQDILDQYFDLKYATNSDKK